MYLMRLLWKTIDSERKAIIFYILNTALLLLIFNLVYPGIMIVYPILISLTILAAYVIVKFVIMYRFLDSLGKAKQGRGYKPNPENCKEVFVFEAMEDIHEHYNNIIIAINDKLKA